MPAKSFVSSNAHIAFNQVATFSSLFTDYTQFTDRIAPFFEGDYRAPQSFDAQAQKTLNVSRDRDLLADVLLEQNARWGLDEHVERNIERLRQNDSVVVITGQQLGLFLSPLYIPYKTLTTIRLATHLQKTLNRPVVPVFWLHGEDHDFAETAPFNLINPSNELISLRYAPQQQASQGPVGRMQFTDDIERVLSDVAHTLPQTPNTPILLDFLSQHFTPGTSLLDAFAKFIRRMFSDTGLVLFSVDDARIKQRLRPSISSRTGASRSTHWSSPANQ